MLYKRPPSQKIGGKAREFGSMLCAWFEVLEMFLSHWLRFTQPVVVHGIPWAQEHQAHQPAFLSVLSEMGEEARKDVRLASMSWCPIDLLVDRGVRLCQTPFSNVLQPIFNRYKYDNEWNQNWAAYFSQKDSIASIMSGIGMYPTNIRIYSPKN